MRFPETFIEELKRQADIVRVVQDYVQLKQKGQNWMACCPFHNEKTPSFSVNPAKEIFYCFGCQKGGGVFNFVMEMERISFPEAVRIVAKKAGVALPPMMQDERFDSQKREADEIIELNQAAMLFWETQLAVSNEGAAGRSYLIERGLTETTCKYFHIGYAPNTWEALSSHLEQQGATVEQIQKSGLVVAKDTGGHYDRFRGRLMFPVFDKQGRPIAFGGRTLIEDPAKYINSPETSAYVKGKHLFGLNFTRDEIRRQGFAILVEGFLDLVVPFQFGVRNMVASLGTSLTVDQVQLLSKQVKKVVVNYDGDAPGIAAAKKSIEILLKEAMEVKVLVLPNGEDPDEFIRSHGVIEYHKKRGSALPHMQFVVNHAINGKNINNPSTKEFALDEILPYIKANPSKLQKREYFDMAMDSLRITNPALRRDLWNSVKSGVKPQGAAFMSTFKPTTSETRLLELMLSYEEVRTDVCLRFDEYMDEQLATYEIFQAICELAASQVDVNFHSLSEKLSANAVAMDMLPLLLMADPCDEPLKEAQRCLNSIWLMTSSRAMNSLKLEISGAEQAREMARRDELALQYLDIARKRAQILQTQARRNRGNH